VKWSTVMMICLTEYWIKWLGIDNKIVPVSEKLRRDPLWGFRQQGCPQRSMSTTATVRHLSVWDWTAEMETVIDITTPRRRLKSFEDRSLRSYERSAACIRSLAKLSLVTFSVTDPANRLYYCWTRWLIDLGNGSR